MQLHGTVAQRRPDLGKMVSCPHCHARRRQYGEKCCNPTYATTKRAWDAEQGFHQMECEERVSANFFPKSFVKKLTHKHHGQSRAFKMRQLSYRFQHEPAFLAAAVKEMQCGQPILNESEVRTHFSVPASEHVPAFAERYFNWKSAQKARAERLRTRESRKINRGIV
jgi:hypothetical protein